MGARDIATKLSKIADRKQALLAAELELAEEIAAITDTDGVEEPPVKTTKAAKNVI